MNTNVRFEDWVSQKMQDPVQQRVQLLLRPKRGRMGADVVQDEHRRVPEGLKAILKAGGAIVAGDAGVKGLPAPACASHADRRRAQAGLPEIIQEVHEVHEGRGDPCYSPFTTATWRATISTTVRPSCRSRPWV